MKHEQPTHFDICAGIGGFALAAAWAGFQTVGFSEIEPFCSKVLKEYWPEVPNYGDLRRLDGRQFRGRIDVLCGGIPCQPASCAGKRAGPKDDRWLWPDALRFLGEALPAFAVFENPLGLLALEGGLVFEALLDQMEGHGYEVCPPIVVPACGVQADYFRYRVFVVAASGRKCGEWREIEQEPFGDNEAQWRQKTSDLKRRGQDASLAGSEGLEVGEKQHARPECQTAVGSRWPQCWPETHFKLLRGIPGLPPRMDRNRRSRIHALGNSVVPAQAFPILKAIRECIG